MPAYSHEVTSFATLLSVSAAGELRERVLCCG
jgi:hypothetical protein